MAVFAEVGVDAATIEDITERADIGKGTFYRHFEDKYALLITLVEGVFEQLKATLRPGWSEAATLRDAFHHITRTHAAFFHAHPDEVAILFQARVMSRLRRGTAPTMEQPFLTHLAAIEKMLSERAKADADAGHLRRLACAAVGLPLGMLGLAMLGMNKEELSALADDVPRLLLDGVASWLE